jgi:hypothetical protein
MSVVAILHINNYAAKEDGKIYFAKFPKNKFAAAQSRTIWNRMKPYKTHHRDFSSKRKFTFTFSIRVLFGRYVDTNRGGPIWNTQTLK